MKKKISRPLAVGVLTAGALLAGGGLLAEGLIASPAASALAGSRGLSPRSVTVPAHPTVTIRVEGLHKTLLSDRSMKVRPAKVDKDGKPADVCSGTTAAAALQQATKGGWSGEYSNGLGYSVEKIKGESHPFSSSLYWAFAVDGRSASTGVCGASLEDGQGLLFYPECSKEKASECPPGTFHPTILELTGPSPVISGEMAVFHVEKVATPSGKVTPGAGLTVKVAGGSYKTNAKGVAHVRAPKPGAYEVTVSAPGAIRDEESLVSAPPPHGGSQAE